MDKTMKHLNRQTRVYKHSQIPVTKVFQQLQQMLWQNELYSIKNIPVNITIFEGINVEFLFSITSQPLHEASAFGIPERTCKKLAIGVNHAKQAVSSSVNNFIHGISFIDSH